MTRGGKGIGRAAVPLCAARGGKLAVLDKDGDAAQVTAEDTRTKGAAAAVAVACEEEVAEAFEKD